MFWAALQSTTTVLSARLKVIDILVDVDLENQRRVKKALEIATLPTEDNEDYSALTYEEASLPSFPSV